MILLRQGGSPEFRCFDGCQDAVVGRRSVSTTRGGGGRGWTRGSMSCIVDSTTLGGMGDVSELCDKVSGDAA